MNKDNKRIEVDNTDKKLHISDVSCRYFDINGKEVKKGDTIRFSLYNGIKNKEFVVRKDDKMNEFGIEGLYPPSMKYLEFEIVNNNDN